MTNDTVAKETKEALDTATQLKSEGNLLDAIEILVRANRRLRAAEIDNELVALRHEAFVSLPKDPPACLPPTVTAATGAFVGSLPEVTPADLSVARLRDGLALNGCLLVRGLIPPERAQELAAGIDTALDAFDAEASTSQSQQDSWYTHFSPNAHRYRVGGRRNWVRATGAIWTADSPRMFFELLETIEQTGVGDLVSGYLGERPVLSANKCTLRRVPVDSNTSWHQDGSFLGEDVRSVNLWLALADCGIDAPGLDLVPRRLDQVVETGTAGAYFDWDVGPEVVEAVAGESGIVRPVFGPGDALLFDHLLLHRTAVAPTMTQERHAMETWFFAPSSYPEGQIPLVY